MILREDLGGEKIQGSFVFRILEVARRDVGNALQGRLPAGFEKNSETGVGIIGDCVIQLTQEGADLERKRRSRLGGGLGRRERERGHHLAIGPMGEGRGFG